MELRRQRHGCTLVVPVALALLLVACGGEQAGTTTDAASDAATEVAPDTTATTGDGDGDPADGPTITVGSFNFGESVTLAEIYAQGLEAAGYPVDRELDLATRELLYAELESGTIDLVPEYAGSALGVGFEGEPSADTDETTRALRAAFEPLGFTVLEPSDAQDKNVFVVTAAFSEEHDVSSVGDLAALDRVVLGGPPECEGRAACLAGLQEVYGLDELTFRSIQETPRRVSSLRNGQIDLAVLFSTDPPLQDEELVVLEETEGIVAAENIVPVLSDRVVDAYGEDLTALIDAISVALTTEQLIDMNTQVYVAGADPADVARTWLGEHGFLDG